MKSAKRFALYRCVLIVGISCVRKKTQANIQIRKIPTARNAMLELIMWKLVLREMSILVSFVRKEMHVGLLFNADIYYFVMLLIINANKLIVVKMNVHIV